MQERGSKRSYYRAVWRSLPGVGGDRVCTRNQTAGRGKPCQRRYGSVVQSARPVPFAGLDRNRGRRCFSVLPRRLPRSFSTRTTGRAPRDHASSPTSAEPLKRSRNELSSREPKIEKIDSRIRSIAGRMIPGGQYTVRPRNAPPVILIHVSPVRRSRYGPIRRLSFPDTSRRRGGRP